LVRCACMQILGNTSEFERAVALAAGPAVAAAADTPVSVFETTIRVLGGLLSAHLFASDPAWGMHLPAYHDVRGRVGRVGSPWVLRGELMRRRGRHVRGIGQELLHKAVAVAEGLLPAFHTRTGTAAPTHTLTHTHTHTHLRARRR
jgi:hypothetical protein